MARNCICTAAAAAGVSSSPQKAKISLQPRQMQRRARSALPSAPPSSPHSSSAVRSMLCVMRSDTPLFRLRHSIYGLANKIWGNERENESPGNEAAMLLTLSLDSLGAGPCVVFSSASRHLNNRPTSRGKMGARRGSCAARFVALSGLVTNVNRSMGGGEGE